MSQLGGRPAETVGGLFQSRYREATLSALIFGVLIGAVMNAAITYAGLKIGFTLGGSAIAAVLGFGVLRTVGRMVVKGCGSIIETNIAQTVASAVNTTNAGVIFTVPVLLLLDLGFRFSLNEPSFWLITLACSAGGVLGCVFIVPLRKQMLDVERLRFPSPTAVAAILKSPGAGAAKTTVLLAGVLIGAAIYVPAGLPKIERPAEVEELDGLVARERITLQQAQQTRTVAGWVEARQAPEEVVGLGKLVYEFDAARKAAESAAEDEELAARKEAAAEALRAGGGDPRSPDMLAYGAYKATAGEIEWDQLKGKQYRAWARTALVGWGYQDLQIRLPEVADRAATDEAGRLVLARHVDFNGDNRPDLAVTDETVAVSRLLGLPPELQLVFAIAPFALGAGYLTGWAGLFVLAGGLLAYCVINPAIYHFGWAPSSLEPWQIPSYGNTQLNRPLGVGMLLGGALMGVIASLPGIREALRSIAMARTAGGRGRDEIGMGALLLVGLLATVALIGAAEWLGGQDPTMQREGLLSGLEPWLARGLTALFAVVWIWFAGIIIAQCAGMTDWSPISGIALLTIVLVMALGGKNDVVGAVMLGAALCVAISVASDMMGDLKTGYIVGAQPRRQQWMEIAVVAIGPVITMLTLWLIVQDNMSQYGVAIGPPTTTTAPQATALETIIKGVRGGEMDYMLYGLGSLMGVLMGLGSFAGLGVLVGLSMYLPVMFILTYGVGCVINILVSAFKGKTWAETWGVPFAAGLIVGEAILSLLFTVISVVRDQAGAL